MAATQSTLRVHQRDQTITFQAEGRGTMAQCLWFRRFAEQCLAGCPKALRIDLRRCTYMDSTFVGLLLFLKRAADRRGRTAFALVCPSPDCNRLLQQMGLDGLFPLVAEDEPDQQEWTELKGGPADVGALKRLVVESHQELACLPGSAGEPFRAVMRCLAQAGDAPDKP